MFLFVGIFYIIALYFIVIFDLKLETNQVALSDNSHLHQLASLNLG